jgi:hypothetical protein
VRKTEVGEFFDCKRRRQKRFATTPLAKVLSLRPDQEAAYGGDLFYLVRAARMRSADRLHKCGQPRSVQLKPVDGSRPAGMRGDYSAEACRPRVARARIGSALKACPVSIDVVEIAHV